MVAHVVLNLLILFLFFAFSHTHTHTHTHSVYRKWNERLFFEMSKAYKEGRSIDGVDPAMNWYQGELDFFDYYIIPLAKKLESCGVFGVSSDEYLNYALKKREEWIGKGEAVTAEMVAKARDQDLARMERQASMRKPVISEMKAAVRTMRSPQNRENMYKRASFRHLRVDSEVSETVSQNPGGFARQPPKRGSKPNQSLSMGAVRATRKRNALQSTGSSEFALEKKAEEVKNALTSGELKIRKPAA